MDERSKCHACGALNGSSATFCGQCFAPLSGAASSQTSTGYTPYSPPGAPAPVGSAARAPFQPAPEPWRPSARAQRVPFLAHLGGGIGLRVIVAAIAALISFGIRYVTTHNTHSFVSGDGTYELEYSGYWSEPTDDFPMPMAPGAQFDVMLESDDAMFMAVHGPVPAGGSLRGLNDASLRQAVQQAGFGASIDDWSAPGTQDIGGKPAAFEAHGSAEMAGMSADFDVALAVTGGVQPQMVMFIHSCAAEGCETSTAEFEQILESISFSEEVVL